MATTKTDSESRFDAVAESRRWNDTVAAPTAGMSIPQRMAFRHRPHRSSLGCDMPAGLFCAGHDLRSLFHSEVTGIGEHVFFLSMQ